jgi:hypothetical protein
MKLPKLNPLRQESLRATIQAVKLLSLLNDDAIGKKPMSDGARKSAIYLVTQAIGTPHQSVAIEHTHNHVSELTDRELGDIATRGGAGVTTTPPRPLNS